MVGRIGLWCHTVSHLLEYFSFFPASLGYCFRLSLFSACFPLMTSPTERSECRSPPSSRRYRHWRSLARRLDQVSDIAHASRSPATASVSLT